MAERAQIINQVSYADVKQRIEEIFLEHTLEQLGVDGYDKALFAFEAQSPTTGEFVGAIVVELFFGQLHIKYLVVNATQRKRGYGHALVNRALEFGRENGCSMAFVETLSFQAPAFYESIGFAVDFVRSGFRDGIKYYYMSMNL